STFGSGCPADINPKPNNLDRRFRIYRETLSRFSCAASTVLTKFVWIYVFLMTLFRTNLHKIVIIVTAHIFQRYFFNMSGVT
ncbi:hypothetical protein ACTMNS_06115, partial [Staphylococcus haemolyticus]